MEALIEALRETEAFEAKELAALSDVPDIENAGNWPRASFVNLPDFSPAQRHIIRETVARLKVDVPEKERHASPLPDQAPYLTYEKQKIAVFDGKSLQFPVATDYDPHDPSQFFTTATGDLVRWDGKTDFSKAKREDSIHAVVKVHHSEVGGVMVPDHDQAQKAVADGFDWFHEGYRCWIGRDGKPYGKVSRNDVDAVRSAQAKISDMPGVHSFAGAATG